MKKILLILFFSVTGLSRAFPVDTSVFKYFPLKVGNEWTWTVDDNRPPGPGFQTLRIISSQVINNKLYYKSRSDYYYSYNGSHNFIYGYYRADSTTGNLYQYDSLAQNGCVADSLNSRKGDSTFTSCYGIWYKTDTGTFNIFNQSPKSKIFNWQQNDYGNGRTYAKNFGIVYQWWDFHTRTKILTLKGCVIDGILYGDTAASVTGVIRTGNAVPEKFSLSQNYPNPFNPSTNIKFSLPKSSAVKLAVYDLSGKLIAALFDGQLNTGNYSCDFDASNIASGVYFYRLESRPAGSSIDNFSEVKKMMFVK